MGYTKQEWSNSPSQSTPISADRLNHIEDGIYDNSIAIEEIGENVESTTNKVTSLSSSSTNTEYPSAKCVYDIIGDVETLLTTLDTGNGVE